MIFDKIFYIVESHVKFELKLINAFSSKLLPLDCENEIR